MKLRSVSIYVLSTVPSRINLKERASTQPAYVTPGKLPCFTRLATVPEKLPT